MKKMLGLMLLIVAFCSPAFAVDGDLFGVESNAGHEVRIDENAVLIGVKPSYELVATNDTLTSAESGKTLVVRQTNDNSTDTVTIVLPSAVVGLQFTVVSADDETIYIDPQNADTIKYLATMTAGDRLTSPAATGDAVTLTCAAANSWYVTPISGSWTDGN